MAPTKKTRTAGKAAGKPTPARAPAKAAKAPARKAVPAKAAPAAAAKKKAAPPAKRPAAKAVVKPPAKPAAAPKPAAAAKPAPAAKPAKAAAAAPAPPAPKVPPKRKPAPLPAKDVEAIRAELLATRATLEKEFEDLEIGSLHVSQSELSGEVSFDEEYADAGTFTFERERDLSLSNNIRDLMDKVDTALRRLNDGTYGTCERCGRAIDKARLKALPYSVLCITCKQQEERVR